MAKTHNLGFPRIGADRELKFALEGYWNNTLSPQQLRIEAGQIRKQNLLQHQFLDFAPTGDFSLYDHVLDTSFLFGNVPNRVSKNEGDAIDHYFRVARGKSAKDDCNCSISAGEMTKWFDTNYHYIVPEFDSSTEFSLHPESLLAEVKAARSQGIEVKPVILGPLTYLHLGKCNDQSSPLELLDSLLPQYLKLLDLLARAGVEWVQIDEPILVLELSAEWKIAFKFVYEYLKIREVKLLLTTYFGDLAENRGLVSKLHVEGIHVDAIQGRQDAKWLANELDEHQVLSLGIIDGRNVWKTDLQETLTFLKPLLAKKQQIWIAPSCSLLHCPVDLESEKGLDEEVYSWLAFAKQKLEELRILGKALAYGEQSVSAELTENSQCVERRRLSSRTLNPDVRQAINNIDASWRTRSASYTSRIALQKLHLQLPLLPTTSIGSFPQTPEIRQLRQKYRNAEIDDANYKARIQQEIKKCIEQQETLGLDVLVHGEAERNDMVEYFGENLEGICCTRFGWVQSYGSRCVKPPIIYGDVARSKPITVDWTKYAQSLSNRPVKGMLTGPVTILNWSFVRDDQLRSDTCQQIALAIREEVLELERHGTRIIQIDEAALREGLPLKQSQWKGYLDWAIASFRLSANGVKNETQIHTHMCYSEFNDILSAISAMDADVITIETSRSDMKLLDAFDHFDYPNDIGPGVFDIHSPNTPSQHNIVELVEAAVKRIPIERLWINPDCGLKTRSWDEVIPALQNMVEAAQTLRRNLAPAVN